MNLLATVKKKIMPVLLEYGMTRVTFPLKNTYSVFRPSSRIVWFLDFQHEAVGLLSLKPIESLVHYTFHPLSEF